MNSSRRPNFRSKRLSRAEREAQVVAYLEQIAPGTATLEEIAAACGISKSPYLISILETLVRDEKLGAGWQRGRGGWQYCLWRL